MREGVEDEGTKGIKKMKEGLEGNEERQTSELGKEYTSVRDSDKKKSFPLVFQPAFYPVRTQSNAFYVIQDVLSCEHLVRMHTVFPYTERVENGLDCVSSMDDITE
jgi:hypothetical protein